MSSEKKKVKKKRKPNVRILKQPHPFDKTVRDIIRLWVSFAKRLTTEMQRWISPSNFKLEKVTYKMDEVKKLTDFIDQSYNQVSVKFYKQVKGVPRLESINLASIKKNPRAYAAFCARRDEHISYFKKYPKYVHQKLTEQLEKSKESVTFHGVKTAEAALAVAKNLGKGDNIAKRHAAFIARDQMGKFSSAICEAQARDVGATQFVWKTSQDERVRPYHARLEGRIFYYDDPPITNAQGQKNLPGNDYQCVPSDSRIRLFGFVHKIFRRFFSGKLVQIITDNNMTLNTTSNHPILTQRGWISAQSIDVDDDIFSCEPEGFFGKEMESDDFVPTAEQIFEAFKSLGFHETVALASPSDFHNDARKDDEINIIGVNRELILERISQFYQQLFHLIFTFSDSTRLTLCAGNSALQRHSVFSDSNISIFGQLFSLLKVHLTESDVVSLRARTNNDICFDYLITNSSSTDSIFDRNSKLTHPILIILDSVLVRGQFVGGGKSSSNNLNAKFLELSTQDIRMDSEFLCDKSNRDKIGFIKPNRVKDKNFRDFSGHLYNFETSNGWYSADNGILHNCRCDGFPIIKL